MVDKLSILFDLEINLAASYLTGCDLGLVSSCINDDWSNQSLAIPEQYPRVLDSILGSGRLS